MYFRMQDWHDIDDLDDLKAWLDTHMIEYIDEDLIEFEAIDQQGVYIDEDDMPGLVEEIKSRYQTSLADYDEVLVTAVREYAEKKRGGE